MRMVCHNCGQLVDAPEMRADGAVRCPQCRALTYVPGPSTRPRAVSGPVGPMKVGFGWPGYAVVALIVAATAFAFLSYRGHVQQWVLSRVLPQPPKDAVRLVNFYCTQTLPGPTNSTPRTLSEGKKRSGLVYLVIEVSVNAADAGVRRLTDAELQEAKRANPGFAMSEAWVSWPQSGWFRILGPRHPRRPASAHQQTAGVFVESPSWNSPPASSRPERVLFTLAFEAEQKLVDAEELSFQFRWRRPLPLKKSEVSPPPKKEPADQAG